MRTYFVRCNFILSPTTVSTNEKSRMFCPLDDVSLGWCVPWTMCPLDDVFLGHASLEWCVPWMTRPASASFPNPSWLVTTSTLMRFRVGTHSSGTRRPGVALSKERVAQEMRRRRDRRPRGVSSKRRISKGHVDQRLHHPRVKYRIRKMKICSSFPAG
jgi:hypothetical protein